jgi:hypothetical protein
MSRGEGLGAPQRAHGREPDPEKAPERMAAHLLARARHLAEKAEPRKRVERAAVDAGEIDAAGPSISERGDRLLRLGRHAEIVREEIERAERQHAEDFVAPGEGRGGRAHAAVAAPDHEGVAVAAGGLRDGSRHLLGREQADLGRLPAAAQSRFEGGHHRVGAAIEQRSGAGVEEDEGFWHRMQTRGDGSRFGGRRLFLPSPLLSPSWPLYAGRDGERVVRASLILPPSESPAACRGRRWRRR